MKQKTIINVFECTKHRTLNAAIVVPVIDYSVRGLCVKQYHRHKMGCPNFGTKAGCPPQAPYFDNYYDMAQPIYAIWNEFDLAAHVAKLRGKYPAWTDYQLRCCLYWQPTARKQLDNQLKLFGNEHHGLIITKCPEAMGINITETMRAIGIILEWPPVNKTYQIALAGYPATLTHKENEHESETSHTDTAETGRAVESK